MTEESIENFFSDLNLPTLSTEAKQFLGKEITLEEINEVISQLPNNKSAGPGGLSAEFYKKFRDNLVPMIQRLIKDVITHNKYPPTMYQVNIILIPKPGRDKQQMSSYRPVSLISIESKIRSKILANRLKTYICSIIHQDQTGFMPNRHIYFNLRRLFNIIYHKKNSKACVISLDAQRAFDQLEWKYMIVVLKKFGFGPEFIKWIETMYTHPVASVITNQFNSKSFKLSHGTRQGCPLSLYLPYRWNRWQLVLGNISV